MNKFEQDCMATHGKKLNGRLKHWCANWDFLPIDETCPEFDSCACFKDLNNVKSGADINAGDGGYSEGTKEKYDEFVKNKSIYSMDYELIDDMIQHFEEQEEYEKCSVLLKFKQDYAENTEDTKSRK